MRKICTFLSVVLLSSVSALAFAQGGGAAAGGKAAAPPPAEPAMAPPQRPAELDALKTYTGKWKCEGKMNMMGKDAALKATWNGAWELDNMWLTGMFEIAKSKDIPMMLKAHHAFGYDAGTKSYVHLWIDSGGGYQSAMAKGGTPEKFDFSGNGRAMGQDVATTETVSKKSEKEFTVVGSTTAGGKAMQSWDFSCKK